MKRSAPKSSCHSLAVPFVVCTSAGGPFDDDAFVAGFQCGDIDRALKVAAANDSDGATFTVRSELVRQLELHAMYRGFPSVEVTELDEEWSKIEFRRGDTP